jgi:PKD repeat protein
MSSSTCPVRFAVTLLVAALAALALPPPAAAQILCQWTEDKTPADPPPANLWTALEPAYTEGSLEAGCEGQFGSPTCEGRDTTFYSRALSPWFGTPYWQSIDIKQGYAFLATSLGFQIWNVNGSMAESPDRLTYKDIRSFAPVNTGPDPHQYFQVMGMEASEDGTLAAVTGGYSTGMLIVKTENKVTPSVLYQDPATETPGRAGGGGVHVQTISGRVYGFLASGGGGTVHVNTRGLWAYDMTSASQLATTPCVDPRPANPNPQCAGVFKGRYSTNRLSHVDGAGDDVNGHFLVASGGSEDGQENAGFTVWKVNDPAAPVQVLSGHSGNRIDGVALWQEGTKFFLALANRGPFGAGSAPKGQMYDVTCIKTGTCGSLPSLLVYEFPLAGYTPGFVAHDSVVQDSTDGGGGQWVYFGFREGQGAQGLQMDWLFNVTGLSASNPPDEITGGNPQNGNVPQPTMQVGNPAITVGYWSYMYHCHPSGSAFYQGRGGVMWGNRFYRAGHSIFDIHRQRNVSPTITVTGPATGYAGDPETFNATASNCTPTAGGWSWTASGGGQVVGGGTTASASIEWSMTGSKTVSAQNTGCPGATSVPATIQILDPAPAIGGVSASPTNAPICTPVTFTANNVTGQPPLTYAWTIEQGGNPVPGEGGPGNPFAWDTEGMTPGDYVGRVTVTGPGGSANATSPQVTLTALQPLPGTGFAITNDPPSFGTVQFHSAAATGATEWRWDFDGDPGGPNTFDLTTTDPVIGPNPVHDYTTVGLKHVWLEVRNCTTVVWSRSARLDVTITEISPLEIVSFAASCPFGQCSFQTNAPITFNHQILGDPDTYEYDWTNDGNDPFEVQQSSTGPITSHTYTAAGAYRPILRIRRGAESVSFTHVATVNVTTGTPPPTPSITVGGPTSLDVGESGTFTASALHCTPTPNGWSWGTSGGTVSGSSNTNSITVSWGSTGPKTVTASNSAGCGAASGTRVVSVTPPGGPGPNPGNLVAAFTVSPADPEAGEVVTFDAGTSAGTPTGWAWTFGDGGSASGMEVTHTYAEPGVYGVALTISKVVPGSGCGSFGQEICTHNVTQNLTVGGDGGGDCVPNDATLCLLGGRFEVTGRWHNHRNGEQGPARVYTPFSGDRTGMFWFFRPDNVELIVKALDATDPDVFPNPAFWFFYGGLSDVEYWITVTDTGDPEAAPKEYHNQPGVICGVPDTGAFPQDPPSQEPRPGGAPLALAAAASGGDGAFDVSSIFGGVSGTCTPTGNNLCLLDGRFSVEVEWHDQHNDTDGFGHPIAGTDRTGYFWFFNSDNVELVTKMIDGAVVNDHFWVLWGALTDVEYTIRVTDTVAGGPPREYHNPPGSFCGGASADAFPSP